jgi:hypothetical protein
MTWLIGCSPKHEELTKYGEIVKGKYWEGLIVNKDAFPHRKDDPQTWTASHELVQNIEPALFEHIQKYGKSKEADQWIIEHLSEYKLQYWGFYNNNVKVLAIIFKHISGVQNGAWKEPSGVLGGWHYYFSVIYDTEKKSFTKVSINADA